MNKKLKKALFVGAILLGTTATFTACSQKNYDDDIANLQAQIDANLKKINEINTLVTSGSVISSTTTTTNGVKITLSNGTSFDIVNGTNGKDGTVWTIGTDGYWYKDATKTNYYALGTNGTNGANGKDGIYYVPNAKTGCFDIYNADGTLKESTTISFLAPGSTITAIDDGLNVTLNGVSGVTSSITIAKTNHLRGLVFVPKYYVEGIPTIPYFGFNYKTQKVSNADSKNESWQNDADGTPINQAATAQYNVNPSNVNVNYVKDNLKFFVQQAQTRTAASKDFDVTPTFVSLVNGILTVSVNVKGTPAGNNNLSAQNNIQDGWISTVALHSRYGTSSDMSDNSLDAQNEGVTSDYARIYKQSLRNIAILDTISQRATNPYYAFTAPDNGDFRYRTVAGLFDPFAAINNKIAWDTNNAGDGCEYKVAYDGSFDLKQYAGVGYGYGDNYFRLTNSDLTSLNMSLSFEIVKNYQLGSQGTSTDQANFISLKDGVVTPQFDGKTASSACIGRTPIIRVKLMHGTEIVRVAYIKIKIVRKINVAEKYSLNLGNLSLSCGMNSTTLKSSETDMNLFYAAENLSNQEFSNTYEFKGIEGTKIGNVSFVDDGTSTHTHIFNWILSKADIIANAGKTISQTAKFVNKGDDSDIIYVTLSTTVGNENAYKLLAANYQTNYWNETLTQCSFNAAVPDAGSTNPGLCVIQNINLESIFRNINNVISDNDIVHFYFNDTQDVIDGHQFIVANGTNYATSTLQDEATLQVIATIVNNQITYNKNSAIAKELINNGDMHAMISAKIYVCGELDRVVDLSFNGNDSFQANFVRPVSITAKAAGNFIDGVDYGKTGSYIAIENLINPTDWRGYSFNDAGNSNYWKYYGISEVTVNTADATCDMSGVIQKCSDVQLELIQQASPWNSLSSPSGYGFLTYKNNGKVVNSAFNIKVKVNVLYTWGTIQSAEITIPVSTTVGQ